MPLTKERREAIRNWKIANKEKCRKYGRDYAFKMYYAQKWRGSSKEEIETIACVRNLFCERARPKNHQKKNAN